MMKKDNFLVVVSIIEGRKFPASNVAGRVLTVEAKFDGQTMVTDPVPHVESPNFTQELAWPVDSKALHQHRLQRSSVKVMVYSTDRAAGSAGREELGYVVLNLRAAQQQKSYNWYTLLNGRHKGCKVKLAIYIDDDSGGQEQGDARPVDVSPSRNGTASQRLKPTPMIDSVGRYYQLGAAESDCEMFHLSVTIDSASGLLQLIPTNIALPSMPYFFYYSLFGNDITTRTFDDLLNPNFYPQQATIRLRCSDDILKQFLAVQPSVELHLFCGDQLLGSCEVHLNVLSHQSTAQTYLEPVSVTEFIQLRPPKASKLALPSVVPDENKPRVRVTIAITRDQTRTRVPSPSFKAVSGVKERGPAADKVPVEKSSNHRQTPPMSGHDDSYSASFESHLDSDAAGGRVGGEPPSGNARPVEEKLSSGDDRSSGRPRPVDVPTDRLKRDSDDDTLTGTIGNDPSSLTEHQLLIPELPHHFNFTVDLRRLANFTVSHPLLVYLRYAYIFFGSTEPVLSHPPVEVRRGTEVVVPHSSCTFPFATTPQHLQETFRNVPLVVEVWQRNHERSENTCLGIVKVALSAVLRSPYTKFMHSKTNSSGTRQTWVDWVHISSTSGGDRQIGDLEVALNLEDLGPIVQPTVVLENASKEAEKTEVPAQKPVDVRETLEYKKAMELQLWMEEQQALYKAKEQQRLKALDEEFHRKLALEMKKGAEYDRLAAELRTALTSLEKREKVLKASEEQVERYREDLQHKHAREMEKLRDASVRLKEDYEHKMELERNKCHDLEETVGKLKRQLSEAEAKIQQQIREFDSYKTQLHAKPEVRLQAEINFLTLEKVELEKKLDAAIKEKVQCRQQMERAMSKLAMLQKKEKAVAKAQMIREKRELEHMRLRYLAAEEKNVISSERKELDELKSELCQLKETTRAASVPSKAHDSLPPQEGGVNEDDEIDDHILRLIEERDSLLRTGVYNRSDRIVADLDRQIREAEAQRKRSLLS